MAVESKKSSCAGTGRFPVPPRALFWGLVMLLLTSCAAPTSLYQKAPVKQLFWPQQPFGPRIAWVQTISNAEEAGITKGFWRRALELLIGSDGRRIVRPHGLLFDASERLYIADTGAGLVHCMDTKKGEYTLIGGEAGSPLRSPIGLAEDGEGRLYVTDSGAGALFRQAKWGDPLERFPVKGLERPTGIAYSGFNGLIYIVDTIASQIIAVDPAGKERYRFGSYGDGSGELNRPTDIAVDAKGRLYVTDALNYKVRMYTASGVPLSDFGQAGDAAGDLDKPKGVALDSEGHIYLTDALLDAVQVFDPTGHLLISFGSSGSGDGNFWMPSGLYIDAHDYIFVSDTYNHRIEVFRFLSGEKVAPAVPLLPSHTNAQPAGLGISAPSVRERP